MSRAGDPPVLLVQWYDLTKWLLERVESFPKSQRFVFGQRLADRSLAILETLVDAAWSPPGPRKAVLLAPSRSPRRVHAEPVFAEWEEPFPCTGASGRLSRGSRILPCPGASVGLAAGG